MEINSFYCNRMFVVPFFWVRWATVVAAQLGTKQRLEKEMTGESLKVLGYPAVCLGFI